MTQPNRRILVVDDEPDILKVLSRHIRNAGLDVRTATSAEEAIDLVGRESFDLVMLDICLPGMTGLGAINILREKTDSAIVVMTGYASDDTKRDVKLLGAVGLLQKPVSLQELLPIIRGESV